jgi:S-formylglutathione hydrolase FrmB
VLIHLRILKACATPRNVCVPTRTRSVVAMLNWLLALRIDRGTFLIPLDIFVALLLLYLLVRIPMRSWILRAAAALVLGELLGLLVIWLVSDVWNVFGLPLTLVTRLWFSGAMAALSLVIVNLWGTHWWRKTIALVAIPVILVSTAAAINVDFGAYRNLNDALGISPYGPMGLSHLSGQAGRMDPAVGRTWLAPSGMPAQGTVGTVTIPGTISGFTARPALVYLPPAALVPNSPVLPVLVMFAGQPGTPAAVFTAGHLAYTMDAYAAGHNGLAPIVVAPDQLGRADQNPMCVDSPLGNSKTYLTQDVPTWIRSHLRVSDDPRYWAVGGFSQGGTCSIQLGAGHPEVFRTILDVSGEVEPTIGSTTVARAFGGSTVAYDAVKPVNVLDARGPYADTVAIFGVGALDAKYQKNERLMRAAAARSGMVTKLIEAPNSAHDWTTVRYVIAKVLPVLGTRLGLG